MAILTEVTGEKFILGKCAVCGGKMERANSGFICNPCRDTMRMKK